jgi:hypothetical protein
MRSRVAILSSHQSLSRRSPMRCACAFLISVSVFPIVCPQSEEPALRVRNLPSEWGTCPQSEQPALRVRKLPSEWGTCPQSEEPALRVRNLPSEWATCPPSEEPALRVRNLPSEWGTCPQSEGPALEIAWKSNVQKTDLIYWKTKHFI